MSTLIFHQAARAISELVRGSGPFRHVFGGPARHEGATRPGASRPAYLVFDLDLADPGLGLDLPGLSRLPLYYRFVWDDTLVAYRVLSDERIEFLGPRYEGADEIMNESHPDAFPPWGMTLRGYPYDPADLEDALLYGAALGLDGLSPTDQDEARRRIDEHLDMLGYDPLSEQLDTPTLADYARECPGPFIQGPPGNACPEPSCPNHEVPGSMRVLALSGDEPVPGVSLFGNKYVQLIFEVCPACRSVYASNQCD